MSYTQVKTEQEIKDMRIGGKMLGEILVYLKSKCVEGITPLELDQLAAQRMKEFGVKPGFLGYYGFPNICCINVNSQVVHGIPSKVPLTNSDVLSIDCGLIYNKLNLDSAITVTMPNAAPEAIKFVEVLKEALNLGIKEAKDGNRTGDIGYAVQTHIEKHGYTCVEELTGHGIGYNLHEKPYVPNLGEKGKGDILKEGMTICIEPIVNMGKPKIKTLKDNWTILTQDGSLSAQEEHTILITKTGGEIISVRPN